MESYGEDSSGSEPEKAKKEGGGVLCVLKPYNDDLLNVFDFYGGTTPNKILNCFLESANKTGRQVYALVMADKKKEYGGEHISNWLKNISENYRNAEIRQIDSLPENIAKQNYDNKVISFWHIELNADD